LNMLEFTEENFDQQVLNSDQPVLADFWAPWRAPCRAMAPAVEAIASENAGRAKVGKLNVDDNVSLAGTISVASPRSSFLRTDRSASSWSGLA
jgi:thioredoxin 1